MKKEQRLTGILLGIYLILLTWLILFKLQLPLGGWVPYRSLNLIPFGASLIVNGAVDVQEILYNGLVFLPFGLYLGMLQPRRSWWKSLLVMAGVSLAYETLQYLLAIGASDITDLLMNTAGGAVGLLVFSALFHGAGEKGIPILNRIALAGTVLVVAGVSLLLALTTH